MSKLAKMAARHASAAANDIRGPIAARVVAYDADEHTVTVQPLVVDRELDPDGELQDVPTETIPGVPVCFLQVGGLTLTAAPHVGEVGLLVTRDGSHDEVDDGAYPATGAVSPASDRRWDRSDAVYQPVSLIPQTLTSSQLRSDGQPVMAFPAGEVLHLGDANATKRPTTDDRVAARFARIENYLNTVTYTVSGSATLAPTPPPFGPTGIVGQVTTADDVASTRLKVDD
jgi:hypothetical protein